MNRAIQARIDEIWVDEASQEDNPIGVPTRRVDKGGPDIMAILLWARDCQTDDEDRDESDQGDDNWS
jgi:hypothetical protein